MAYGVCKLTGNRGKLVRSHLLPKALTRSPTPNEPRVEAGEGFVPIKRYDSWFDNTIVTRDGENILERYDSWAIRELRRLGLVWSGGRPVYDDDPLRLPDGWEMRQISGVDGKRLRLFFLSLLWRAAVTKTRGFTTIHIDDDRLEVLRRWIVSGDGGRPTQFPVTLFQLTTRGPWHNLTPVGETKTYPDEPPTDVQTFRFFIDGMIAHIGDDQTDVAKENRWGKLVLGADDKIWVLAHPFEGSSQADRLSRAMLEAETNHLEIVSRILGWDKTAEH